MAALTLIARVSDGLILSEAMDNDASGELDVFRTQAKKIFKTLSPMSQKAMTIDTGNHYFAYLIAGDVCYLTLCERGYPKKLIFKFLEELQKEFEFQYAAEVPTAKRPYAFIKFDTVIQKTKKAYADSRTARNLQRVTEDLTDVQRIMNKNIADILGRGEKIDSKDPPVFVLSCCRCF